MWKKDITFKKMLILLLFSLLHKTHAMYTGVVSNGRELEIENWKLIINTITNHNRFIANKHYRPVDNKKYNQTKNIVTTTM